jgi:hypothetical protein
VGHDDLHEAISRDGIRMTMTSASAKFEIGYAHLMPVESDKDLCPVMMGTELINNDGVVQLVVTLIEPAEDEDSLMHSCKTFGIEMKYTGLTDFWMDRESE